MIFFTFLTALALSAVAAYYSVIGLAAIFPGSYWPIIIMGSVLEAAKLVTVSWLYRNWKVAHLGMKTYLSAATIILMLITSMGIFGYLSKAHLEHSSDTAPLAAKVELLDEKIRVAKENLNANRKILKQLDEQVDQALGRSSDEKVLLIPYTSAKPSKGNEYASLMKTKPTRKQLANSLNNGFHCRMNSLKPNRISDQ